MELVAEGRQIDQIQGCCGEVSEQNGSAGQCMGPGWDPLHLNLFPSFLDVGANPGILLG